MLGNFFKGVKNKAVGLLLKQQMKNLPPEQQEMILGMIEKNPEIFEKIAKEIKEKTDAGQNQMYASMQVMQKYQSELQKVFAETGGQPKQKIIYKTK